MRNITLAVTVSSEKKKALTLKSAWITKKGQHISPQSDVQAPNQTSDNELSMNAVNNSISQENGFVNSENLATTVGQARNYAKIFGMGENGTRGLATLAEDLPDGVDLGEVALAFNAIYRQGKSGKALSAAKNMELLSPEQRQYAYNLGIMDGALDSARAKKEGGSPPASDVQNSSSLTQRDATPAGAAAEIPKENDGKVLQKDGVGDTIKENEYAERSTKYDETLVEEKTGAEEERRNRNAAHDGGANSDNGESSSRVGRANEDGSPVSKRARETTPRRQTLRKRLNRRLNFNSL